MTKEIHEQEILIDTFCAEPDERHGAWSAERR